MLLRASRRIPAALRSSVRRVSTQGASAQAAKVDEAFVLWRPALALTGVAVVACIYNGRDLMLLRECKPSQAVADLKALGGRAEPLQILQALQKVNSLLNDVISLNIVPALLHEGLLPVLTKCIKHKDCYVRAAATETLRLIAQQPFGVTSIMENEALMMSFCDGLGADIEQWCDEQMADYSNLRIQPTAALAGSLFLLNRLSILGTDGKNTKISSDVWAQLDVAQQLFFRSARLVTCLGNQRFVLTNAKATSAELHDGTIDRAIGARERVLTSLELAVSGITKGLSTTLIDVEQGSRPEDVELFARVMHMYTQSVPADVASWQLRLLAATGIDLTYSKLQHNAVQTCRKLAAILPESVDKKWYTDKLSSDKYYDLGTDHIGAKAAHVAAERCGVIGAMYGLTRGCLRLPFAAAAVPRTPAAMACVAAKLLLETGLTAGCAYNTSLGTHFFASLKALDPFYTRAVFKLNLPHVALRTSPDLGTQQVVAVADAVMMALPSALALVILPFSCAVLPFIVSRYVDAFATDFESVDPYWLYDDAPPKSSSIPRTCIIAMGSNK